MKRLFMVQDKNSGHVFLRKHNFSITPSCSKFEDTDPLCFELKTDAKIQRDWLNEGKDKPGYRYDWIVVSGPDHHRYEK